MMVKVQSVQFKVRPQSKLEALSGKAMAVFMWVVARSIENYGREERGKFGYWATGETNLCF